MPSTHTASNVGYRPQRHADGGEHGHTATRALPSDLALEEGLVGAVIYRPELLATVGYLAPDDFHLPSHQHVWAACQTLAAAGQYIDNATVTAELRARQLLDDLGTTDGSRGPAAVVHLLAVAAFPTAAAAYAARVADLARARRLVGLAHELTETGYAGDLDAATELLQRTATEIRDRAAPSLMLEDVASVIRGNVATIAPSILRREDGACLVYPGLTHSIFGEPGLGKSFVALIAAAQVIDDGGTVMWLDYEGNRRICGDRLRSLGVSAEACEGRFLYMRPGKVGPVERAELANLAETNHPTLAVVDGVARAIARQGGDEDKASDVLAFLDAVVTPLTEAGAAAVTIDHVIKAKEGRDRWARGSGAKLGEIEGAAYLLEAGEPFNRASAGSMRLVVSKDREGLVGSPRQVAAVIRIAPVSGGVTVRVMPPSQAPTGLAVAVVKVLQPGVELSQAGLITAVRDIGERFRTSALIEVADGLSSSGVIRSRPAGSGKARLYSAAPEAPSPADLEEF